MLQSCKTFFLVLLANSTFSQEQHHAEDNILLQQQLQLASIYDFFGEEKKILHFKYLYHIHKRISDILLTLVNEQKF